MPQETYLTPEGLDRLKEELQHLRTVRRAEVADELKRSAEMGTVDNAEYDEAKNEQARVEGRIRTLEQLISGAVLIPEDHEGKAVEVQVGAEVVVTDEENRTLSFTIVGSEEADPARNRISNVSPIGKALLGRKARQRVEVQTPVGKRVLKIVKVGWPQHETK